jgi:hypothetical protein
MKSTVPGARLSFDEIDALVRDVMVEAQTGRKLAVWQKVQPLRNAQSQQAEAATALLWVVDQHCLEREAAIDILSEVAESHDQNPRILSALGRCLAAVRDIDDLNSAPPSSSLFRAVLEKLEAFAALYDGKPEQVPILEGLATSARMLARQHDAIAESSYRKLTAIEPQDSAHHYNLGLFFKTRGRFAEGVVSNQVAASLLDEVDESYEWNLGICATGAGNAELALDVWRRMGLAIEIGRFGLPEGSPAQCKVKIAERPLAERTADADDPGAEETIWIGRLSPCHGVIRSVLYQKLGIDYGDVVLIDGAPITYHTYGEVQVPVFPHLATLVRRNYQLFDFAGTQDTARQLANLSPELDEDAVIYSHSESVTTMCASCWRDPDLDHDHHERVEKHVVRGRIAAPPEMAPARLLDMIDKTVEKQGGQCQLYAPDLSAAAGLHERERIDRRRFALLTGSSSSQTPN